MACSKSWACGDKGPKTHKELRAELTKLAKKKKGKQLISAKFTKDHIYAGHNGDVTKLAAALSKLREKSLSTIMITSMDSSAQAEVLNWIANVPDGKLKYNKGTWTIDTAGSTVSAAGSYKFGTVDLEALRGMDKDDVVKKSRHWLTVSTKTPKVACQFESDGTPVIYHLDY